MNRIALFLADLRGGGAERMMVNLAAGFCERGVKVDLLLAHAVGPYLAEVPADVNLIDLRTGSAGRSIPALVKYLRRKRPDVFLTTLHHSSLAASIAHKLSGGASLLFVREANTQSARSIGPLDVKAQVISRSMSWVYGQSTGILAVSEGVAEDLRRRSTVPPRKVTTLFNPVLTKDIPHLAAQAPDHPWFGTGDPPVILGVGSLQRRKGFATLIEAFGNVREDREARLVILGEGPDRVALERLVHDLGLSDAVSLPGFVPNPFGFMQRSSVFVLSSLREGLPGVLIQAMACGCPVVSTDCPSGPREILVDGQFGALVPMNDPKALAHAIVQTLDAPRDGDQLRTRSKVFDAATVVDAHLRLFNDALRDDGTRRCVPATVREAKAVHSAGGSSHPDASDHDR